MFSISLYHIQDLGQPVEIHMALADLAGEKRHVQADTRAASCKLPALYMQVTKYQFRECPSIPSYYDPILGVFRY
jgi:hypothetical protein